MTIATEKVKLATERFMLVRLNPARFIEPPAISAPVYGQDFPYPINRVERNGVALTQVTAVSNNDEWSYDETTGALEVQLASAPNDTTNVLIAYYYLFYTGTVFRAVSEDPENTATTVRYWEPRITTYPSIGQSFDNILAGVFTITSTGIELINDDGQFQEYLTDDDSFYQKQVDIWLCINSVSNIQKVFTGTITNLSLGQNRVQLSIVDSFNKLKQPAFLGDTSDEAVFSRDSGSFPSLDPKHNLRPCPYIVGSSSRYQTFGQAGNVAGAPDPYLLSVGTEAYSTAFNAQASVIVNRTWGTCRIKGSVATQAFGTVQAVLDTGAGYTFVRFSTLSNAFYGDTIKWTEAGTDYYGLINHFGTFTYLAVNYNLIISSPNTPFTLASVVANQKSFGVFIEAPNETTTYIVPRYGRDYTVTETPTSGSNNYLEVSFVNNFEASHAGFSVLDPNAQQVFFRTSNTTVQTHGDILKEMVTKAGLTPEATSFGDADTGLPVNARFHIPNFDEDAADFYLKYVQDVLASTLGYLKVNSDFEVEYHLLSAPASFDVRDNFLMLDEETACAVEYQDIATKIIAYNPHNDSGDAIDDANTPAATAESTKARYLHGLVNVDRFRHCLEELTSKITDHINLKSMRAVRYSLATATEDIDTELGDDLELQNKIVLGSSDTQDVKITSIEKSPSSIRLEARDLKGL